MSDHVHLCLSIPPKYSISYVVGYLKGKSAIRLHQDFSNMMRGSKSFWARGYFVSTVGLDEHKVRQYIRHQEKNENRQMEFDFQNKEDKTISDRPLSWALLKLPAMPVVRDILIKVLDVCRIDDGCM